MNSYDEEDDSASSPKDVLATREGKGVMTTQELKAAIGPVLVDCVSFVDSVLSPEREIATNYYLGKPFGNEEDGRSQVVLTELRDAVSGIAPDVLKIFFGPERTVEFLPKSAESVALAKLQTDYIHFQFTERNNGFLESLSVLKDGLIRKIGIFKSWWDESTDVRAYTLRNVTDDELTVLASNDDVKLLGVKETGVQDADDLPPAPPPQPGPDGQPQPAAPAPKPQKLHTVHMTRSMPGRLRVKALPPEEFMYNRSARDLETATVLAHRTRKTRGQLLALGVKEKDIDTYAADPISLQTNVEEVARRPDGSMSSQIEETAGKANEEFEYVESYIRIDYDGDGIAELRQICTLGPNSHPVMNEPVDEHPFAIFIPDPEPHTLHGQSLYDRVGDMQLMKSSILRAQADSLSLSIFPRLAYVEGQANVNDILNVEIGAPIRMRSVGAVTPLAMPYSGEMATPMLQYLNDVVERRTGRSKGTEGLDADALQSTTSSGVDAAIAGSRAQTEMLARIFAEMTLKPLFRRMYRLVVQNQPDEFVKLRDAMHEVSPQGWETDLDVSVNVALGSTLVERKLQVIGSALQKQEQVIQLLGPQNPIVSLSMYADTLRRGVELGGFKDSDSFFMHVDPNWQPPQQPPQPSPEMAMVQIEQQKSQHQAQMKELEMQQAQQQAQADLAQKQAQMQQDYALKIAEMRQKAELESAQLQAQFGAQVNTAQINADTQASLESARLDAENRRHAATLAAELEKHKYETDLHHQRETSAMQLEHERKLEEARIAAQAKVQVGSAKGSTK